ncbi:MAG: hypothetical protein EA357_04290 [Micavibrio sp.]|nr:MAG: hypothetical protein EA357_04290 [Micavibrio sp.]
MTNRHFTKKTNGLGAFCAKARFFLPVFAVAILLAVFPPQAATGSDVHETTGSREASVINANSSFVQAVYVKVEHERFTLPFTDDTATDNRVVFRQAAVTFFGGDGESAFLSCDILPERALVGTARNNRDIAVACDGTGTAGARRFLPSGDRVNTGVALTGDMAIDTGQGARYVSLEISYI